MPTPTLLCSLCQQEIPAAELRQHQEQEKKDIEAYAIELIKESNPEWAEGDPVCQKCWDYYRRLPSA